MKKNIEILRTIGKEKKLYPKDFVTILDREIKENLKKDITLKAQYAYLKSIFSFNYTYESFRQLIKRR